MSDETAKTLQRIIDLFGISFGPPCYHVCEEGTPRVVHEIRHDGKDWQLRLYDRPSQSEPMFVAPISFCPWCGELLDEPRYIMADRLRPEQQEKAIKQWLAKLDKVSKQLTKALESGGE